jgi:hypothetical protein
MARESYLNQIEWMSAWQHVDQATHSDEILGQLVGSEVAKEGLAPQLLRGRPELQQASPWDLPGCGVSVEKFSRWILIANPNRLT